MNKSTERLWGGVVDAKDFLLGILEFSGEVRGVVAEKGFVNAELLSRSGYLVWVLRFFTLMDLHLDYCLRRSAGY